MKKSNKIFLRGILLGITIIFLLNFTSAICCEKTLSGGVCLDVGGEQYCDKGYRIDNTACESTQYCSTGTCVNNAEGICMTSSSSACDPNLGGYWSDEPAENMPECKIGCCFIGEGTSFTWRTNCNKRAADIGIVPDFRENLGEEECLLSAGATEEGACVYTADQGKKCTVETYKKCTELGREHHAGFLCSAPELGTICTMTKRTKCVEGRHEVYFEDNCGNAANVYDANKTENIDYWTYIKDPASSEICEYGGASILSQTCGNCNYIGGSTCGTAKAGEIVKYGKNICKDLGCTYKGTRYNHGNAWCSEPLTNFENATPGQVSYRLYCYNGEVEWELCDSSNLLRNRLCNENVPGKANCVQNKWEDCIFQTNSKDCLNIEMRDCIVKTGVSRKNETGGDILFSDSDSNPINATCVPKYTPAFKFWDPGVSILGISSQLSPADICSAASVSAVAGYHKSVFTKWEAKEGACFKACVDECADALLKPECQQACFNKCPASETFMDMASKEDILKYVDLNADWASNAEGLCVAVGDCGVKPNYIQANSYYSWKELFIGDNITKTSIPQANDYR